MAAPALGSYMIPGAPWRAKDFAFVKKDGVYHLFYIRNNSTLPLAQTEIDLGHAVSNDLYHWTQLPPVMRADTTSWDNYHVWAPTIVEQEGLHWMLYTGVTNGPGMNQVQRTGLAVSEDLSLWRRVDAPVFSAADVPWAWWQPASASAAFRDPFVMPDPQNPGSWLMYYTGTPASDTTGTLIGVARSTGDFTVWADVKPLWITHQSFTFNPLTESPHLFQRNGLWYLFITTSSGQPLTFYTSSDPIGDPSAWTYRGRLRNMLGYDTSFWFASEALRDGTRQLFAFVSGDRIEMREILWTGPWQFALVQPPLMHVLSLTWQQGTARDRDTVQVEVAVANPFSGLPAFEVVAKDSAGLETVFPYDSLGGAGITLFGDTTMAPVVVKRLPSRSDTTSVVWLKLRTTDQTAESGWLAVGPPPSDTAVVPPTPTDTLPDLNPPDLEDRPRSMSVLDAVTRTPLGGPAVLLRLDEAAHARVDMYDLQGRRLATLADRVLPGGLSVLPWDARDAAGARVPNGVYFARAVLPGRVATTRVFVLPR
jgi:hypothetical protein